MPVARCPVPGCTYATENVDAIIVAALLNAHTVTHTTVPAAARVQKVTRPTVSSAGTSEEWSYFTTRWAEAGESITEDEKIRMQIYNRKVKKDEGDSSKPKKRKRSREFVATSASSSPSPKLGEVSSFAASSSSREATVRFATGFAAQIRRIY